MDPIGIAVLVSGAALITFELIGVARHKQGKQDTVTEYVKWFTDHTKVKRVPVGNIVVTGSLVWLALHFNGVI